MMCLIMVLIKKYFNYKLSEISTKLCTHSRHEHATASKCSVDYFTITSYLVNFYLS